MGFSVGDVVMVPVLIILVVSAPIAVPILALVVVD